MSEIQLKTETTTERISSPKSQGKKASRSTKWGFHYKPGFSDEEMFLGLMEALTPDKVILTVSQFKTMLINRKTSHILVSLTFQASKTSLKILPFIDGTSIQSWSNGGLKNLTDYERFGEGNVKSELLPSPLSKVEPILFNSTNLRILHELAQGQHLDGIVVDIFRDNTIAANTLYNIKLMSPFYQLFEKYCQTSSFSEIMKVESLDSYQI